jgi:hypothetical protein
MELRKHLLLRYFDLNKYPNVSLSEDSATFPLFNLSGRMVGYQHYAPNNPKVHLDDPKLARYYTWVTKPCASKTAELAVWGLETYDPYQPLFLTEGVFDACRLHWNGLNAVACLGCNPVHLRSWLSALPNHKVACVQGDKAGLMLADYGDSCVYLPEGKDVGDLTEEEFGEYFARYVR